MGQCKTGRMGESEPWTKSSAHVAGSWLKHWLHRGSHPTKENVDYELLQDYSRCPFWTRGKLLLAAVLVLALIVMVLLFLWNYKCIMEWHSCDQETYSGLYMIPDEKPTPVPRTEITDAHLTEHDG